MKRTIKLTERDLSRIVKRVMNEENEEEMSDPCTQKLKKLRDNPTYSRVIKKMEKYNSLSWWEWYDKLQLALTVGEHQLYLEYLMKESQMLIDCYKKEQNK
jgi:hypothetical protein